MKEKPWNKKVETTKEQDMFNNLLELRKQIIEQSVSDVQSTRHRLETITTWNDIAYINDSKATNVDLTWYSLERMEGNVVWIVGGFQEGQDYDKLKDLVHDKVKAIVCLGKTHSKVFKTFIGNTEVIVGTSSANEAVKAATALASEGDTVLLSPACSSHDLFESYEDRGNQFTKAVKQLLENEK